MSRNTATRRATLPASPGTADDGLAKKGEILSDDAKLHVRGVRVAVALAVGLALGCAPAALAQTTARTTGPASETGAGPDVSKLPICGRPAPPPPAAARRTPLRRSAAKSPAITSPALGTLTLDQEDQETVTSAAFGRSTDPQPLTLVYRVAGCRVTDALPRPTSPLPTGPVRTAGSRTLPGGTVQVEDVDADADRYVVHLRIYASADSAPAGPASPDATVGAGSYTGFVRLKAAWMHTVATPVTVTRSENRLWVPIGIGILGSACGFFLFWLVRRIHHDNLLVKEKPVLIATGVASVVVGAGSAFFTNYINQDVWTWSANGLALFTAAFSASTAGVAAGLLTGIYKDSAPAPASR